MPRLKQPITDLNWLTNSEVRDLVERNLPDVLVLALRAKVRTPVQQEALLALARLVDNPFWAAEAEVERSWMNRGKDPLTVQMIVERSPVWMAEREIASLPDVASS